MATENPQTWALWLILSEMASDMQEDKKVAKILVLGPPKVSYSCSYVVVYKLYYIFECFITVPIKLFFYIFEKHFQAGKTTLCTFLADFMEDGDTLKKGEDSGERERKFEFEFTSVYRPTKGIQKVSNIYYYYDFFRI